MFVWMKMVHFLGLIGWVGGLVAVGMLMLAAGKVQAEDSKKSMQDALVVFRRFVKPAMLIAFVGGIGMLVQNWHSLYAKAGWMHSKLTLLVVLVGVTEMYGAKWRRALEADDVAGVVSRARIVVPLATVVAFGIVLLVVLRPF